MGRELINPKDVLLVTLDKMNVMFEELYNSIQITKTSQITNDSGFITEIPSFNIEDIAGVNEYFESVRSEVESNRNLTLEQIQNFQSSIDSFQNLLMNINSSLISQNNLISSMNNRILDIENQLK